MKTLTNSLPRPALLVVALAGLLSLPAAHAAGEFITAFHLGPDDRCASVSERGIVLAGHGINATGNRPTVWRAGGAPLSFGGGRVTFTVWGNVDLANDIRLEGITRDAFSVGRKRGGAENASRGCGARGSVDITIDTAAHPSAAQRGRLRFGFALGAPLEVPVVLQPVPGSLDLRWPSRFEAGVRVGEHHDCLRANGGHVKVDGDTLEIGLNPDNPMPRGCDLHSLEVTNLGDLPVLRGTGFSGGPGAGNRGITQVQGPASVGAFASGQDSPLGALQSMLAKAVGAPDPSGRFPALRIDYAAAGRALRAAPALQAPTAAARSGVSGDRFARPAAPVAPAPRAIEFTLALASFNSLPNLHAPMRVRLVEAGAAARSDLAAAFEVSTVCANPMQVSVRDLSTSSLAITRRELDGGAGQRITGGAQPINTVLTYAQPGSFNITLQVTDANGFTQQHRQPVTLPRGACNAAAPPTAGGIRVGAGSGANLLPARLFPERPLLRRIGGLGTNVMVPGGFCAGLGNDARGRAQVPPLSWGLSAAGGDVASARVELRDDASGRVLSSFDARVPGNSAPVTRENYPGRPTSVAVVNVTGPLMRDFGNQAGCFLDPAVATPPLDPAFRLVADPANAVAEGPDAATTEADNELTF